MNPHSKQPPQTGILVQVNYGRRRCFHTHANTISADGMFLSTRTLSLPINSNISLKFSIGNDCYEISAIVTGDCSDGIYVGFHKLQPNAYDSFCRQRDLHVHASYTAFSIEPVTALSKWQKQREQERLNNNKTIPHNLFCTKMPRSAHSMRKAQHTGIST